MLAPYRGGLFDPLATLGATDLSDFFNPDTMMAPFAFPQSLTSRGGDQFGVTMSQVQSKAPTMNVDVIEKDDAYLVHAEIPGVNKDDVDIRFDQGVLTITAEKKARKEWRRGEGGDEQQLLEGGRRDGEPASEVTSGEGGKKSGEKESTQLQTSVGSQLQPFGQQGWRWYHSERSYGRTKRTIRLPKDASPDAINARYENGVLEVEIKKLPEEQRQARKINIA